MTKKQMKWRMRAMIVMLIALGLVAGGSLVTAAGKESLREVLLRDIIAKLPPSSLVQVLEKVLAGGSKDENLGLNVITASASGLTNLRLAGALSRGSSSSTYIYRTTQYDVEVWPISTNTLSFQNTRSTTSTVEDIFFDMTGTRTQVVSSSFAISCGTSTSAFAPRTEVDPNTSGAGQMKRNFINEQVFVTSSQKFVRFTSATTTLTVSNSNWMPLVGPNEYLVCRADIPDNVNRQCTDGTCEPVTSTNRGWIMNVGLRWGFTDGL